MKKIFYFVIIFVLFIITPQSGYAQTAETAVATSSPTSSTSRKTDLQNQRLENLRTRALAEIDRRIASLQEGITRLGILKKLSPEQRQSLTTQVQTEITNLTTLKTKIQSDTDLVTLQADTKSIVNSYRIYALFIPQIHILAASDVIQAATAQFTELISKIQARLLQAQTNGKDVATLQTSLTALQTKIDGVTKQAIDATNLVTPLTPEGYPANKTTLMTAKTMLLTAKTDLQNAKKEARTILQGLKTLAKQEMPSSTTQTVPILPQ